MNQRGERKFLAHDVASGRGAASAMLLARFSHPVGPDAFRFRLGVLERKSRRSGLFEKSMSHKHRQVGGGEHVARYAAKDQATQWVVDIGSHNQ